MVNKIIGGTYRELIVFFILFAVSLFIADISTASRTDNIVIKLDDNRVLTIDVKNIEVPGHSYISFPFNDKVFIFSNNKVGTNYGPFSTKVLIYYVERDELIETEIAMEWRVLDVDRFGNFAFLALDGGYYSNRAALGILDLENLEFNYLLFNPYDYGHGVDVVGDLLAYIANDLDEIKSYLVVYRVSVSGDSIDSIDLMPLWDDVIYGVGSLDVSISPSGRYVAIPMPGPGVRIYNALDGELLASITLGDYKYGSFSVEWIDDNFIVLGYSNEVYILKYKNGGIKVIQRVEVPVEVVHIRYLREADILVASPGISVFKIVRDGEFIGIKYLNSYYSDMYYYDPIISDEVVVASDPKSQTVTLLTFNLNNDDEAVGTITTTSTTGTATGTANTATTTTGEGDVTVEQAITESPEESLVTGVAVSEENVAGDVLPGGTVLPVTQSPEEIEQVLVENGGIDAVVLLRDRYLGLLAMAFGVAVIAAVLVRILLKRPSKTLHQPETLEPAIGASGAVAGEERLDEQKGEEEEAWKPGLKEIESVLARPIEALKRELAACASSEYTVVIPRWIAPEGYQGEWRCCRLGCGGWGCAYRCQRPQGGEPVVFKVPRGLEDLVEKGVSATVDPRLVERVRREAEAMAKLRHPHLLRLLAYGKAAPVLVYEYANGGSLEAHIARGWRPATGEALLVALQLGDALRYIHTRGILHGDVKPGNIFVKDGVVKLGDFSSLVRLATMTSMQSMSYTPGWRAPEQVYIDLKRQAVERGLENRIDVYQLGNLLLYMLTGETIDAEEALNHAKLEEALAKVGDSELRGLLYEMLAPEPWRRPSMEEAVKRLYLIYKRLRT